jgi:cytochrome c oxidase subunit IV
MSDAETTTTEPTQDPEQNMLVGTEEEREREQEYGLQEIRPEELPLLPGELTHHPSPFQYVIIAMILVVITAVEVGVSYLDGDIPKGLIIFLLLSMGLVKFVTVAAYYMHLKTDKHVFRRFFIMAGVGAIILYTIVLTTLHVWSGGA